MSPAESILRTVAGSPLASPERRAFAQLALELGAFDPPQSLRELIANSYAPAAPTDFLSDLARALRAQQQENSNDES